MLLGHDYVYVDPPVSEAASDHGFGSFIGSVRTYTRAREVREGGKKQQVGRYSTLKTASERQKARRKQTIIVSYARPSPSSSPSQTGRSFTTADQSSAIEH